MSVLGQDINISYSLVKEHKRNFLVKTMYITFFALYDKRQNSFMWHNLEMPRKGP